MERSRNLMPENFARYYDAIVPWEKRLAREMPLLEALARATGGRVLVPACGTGGHVVALAERGFQVLGFDADEGMLEVARRKLAASAASITAAQGEADVRRLTLEEAGTLGPNFAAAFCLGNALPGLSAPGQLLAALQGIAAALRSGGTLFTQNLNFDLRWRGKAHGSPLLQGETDDEEVLLVKFSDYEAEFINFHAMFLTRKKSGGPWHSQVRTSRWVPLFRGRMADLLAQAGFTNLRFWGDYAQSPFDPDKSNDLLVAAEKS